MAALKAISVEKQQLGSSTQIENNSDMDMVRDSWVATSYNHISPLALDIGGSLIKLVYFTRRDNCSENDVGVDSFTKENAGVINCHEKHPLLSDRLHFAMFETSKIHDCLDFIQTKSLHKRCCNHGELLTDNSMIVKATGGGAFKFADIFKEKLGVNLDKEDEMDCLVDGANFLLKNVHREAFMYVDGHKEFARIDKNDLFPYLLVNIGSGVSMIKVDGDGKYERVSGTNVGGGTFLGLGRLLTKTKTFDELLEMSRRGNNREIDMLVSDIYGGQEYAKIGLPATAIASSFGKPIAEDRELEDYRPEDIARSLLRLISNNVSQIAYLNAQRYGLKRIFFGGFFIRDHEYTMDTISVGVQFWSKGEAKAMFLRHEGFLGALGAFKSYEKHGLQDLTAHHFAEQSPVLSPHVKQKQRNPHT